MATTRLSRFTCQNLANVSWAFAKMLFCDFTLMDAVADEATLKTAELSTQAIANLSWAFAKLLIRSKPFLEAMASQAALLRHTSAQNLVNTAWAFSKLEFHHPAFYHTMSSRVPLHVQDLDPQHFSNLAWALAALVMRDEHLAGVLATGALRRMSEFAPQDLANCAWAYAKMAILHRSLLTAIAGRSRHFGGFSLQNISNTLWAFATLAVADLELFDAVACASLAREGEWNPQGISNTMWAFATVVLLNRALVDLAGREALKNVGHFQPQELVNTAWAFAVLAVASWPVLHAISDASLTALGRFNPHDLSGLAWAFSTVKFGSREMFTDLGKAFTALQAGCRPQDLANMGWAFGNLGLCEEALLEMISISAVKMSSELQPQDLSNTLWAFAKVAVTPSDELQHAVAKEALKKLKQLEPQNLAMMAWSFAVLGIVNEQLANAIALEAVQRLSQFATHDLANLLWSFPAMELHLEADCPLFELAREILCQRLPSEVAQHLDKLREDEADSVAFEAAERFTKSLLELAWAYAFTGEEMGDLEDVLRQGLLSIGKLFDLRPERLKAEGLKMEYSPSGLAQPEVVLDLPEMAALLKPPGWEVDARAGGAAVSEGGLLQLSRFLRSTFPQEQYPLVHCREHQFGIIHRLDAPSSGLILVGKTMQSYFHLRWQQDTYSLGREYLVLCHGYMASPQVISAKIKTSKVGTSLSWVSDDGRPAWTQVQALCFLRRGDAILTLVLILIRTGRTHQIRVHMQHIGHPTVTDGKYCDPDVFSSDLVWCPRNFLHRHRLTFEDLEGETHEAEARLPEDLCAALRSLHAWDAASQAAVERLLAGWVPKAR